RVPVAFVPDSVANRIHSVLLQGFFLLCDRHTIILAVDDVQTDLGRKGVLYVAGSGVLVFFFFQAEDGIRDWSVTGVQTCALPILLADAQWLQDFHHAGRMWPAVCHEAR